MKTIEYNEVLYRAAEAAGRTRDNIPLEEAALLKSVFAVDLPSVWNSEAWNDLVPDLLSVTLDAAQRFANPYPDANGTELGDILGIYSANPNTTQGWERLQFFPVGASVQVLPGKSGCTVPATVFVRYLTPCPDLLSVSAADLPAYELPLFLGNWLALRGAAQLLTADGASGLAGVQLGLAESSLSYERARILRPPWAKQG